MYLLALTGGIASGKSLVASRLTALGAAHIDADALAREVVAPGSEGLAEIGAAFGAHLIAADGTLDRPALAAIVFGDPAALQQLNDITHPRVRQLARQRIAEAADADPDAVIIYDVPLLAESGKGAPSGFDGVAVVHAEREERVRRMVEDRGMSRSEAEARIAAQATDEERLRIADFVIDNTGTLDQLDEQVDRLWEQLSALARR